MSFSKAVLSAIVLTLLTAACTPSGVHTSYLPAGPRARFDTGGGDPGKRMDTGGGDPGKRMDTGGGDPGKRMDTGGGDPGKRLGTGGGDSR